MNIKRSAKDLGNAYEQQKAPESTRRPTSERPASILPVRGAVRRATQNSRERIAQIFREVQNN